ncbi:MAG: M90 family metallopeptidase [Campylobacterota bacterium]
MTYLSALLLLFGGLGATLFGLYFLYEMRSKQLLHKIDSLDFPESYKKILSKTPHYSKLCMQDQKKLQRSILRFIYTKEFMGVGLEVTDEMKVVIAFYACLLLMHKEVESCYEELKTIIVYPHAVIVKEVKSAGGIFTKEQFVIQGQSANDTVVITWHEAKKEAYHLRHNNVIIHEFAHEIDFMDGYIDGVPPLEQSKYDGWVNTFYKEFAALNKIALKNRDWGRYKMLGSYAASNEAEFFAVVTERFFEAPVSLKHHFPNLYNELESFYEIDTVKLLS